MKSLFTWNRQKLVRKIFLYSAMLVALLLLLSFLFRNILFSYYLDKYVACFNKAFHAELVVKKARFLGISAIEINGITLRPLDGDTLLRIDTAFAAVSFWKFLMGRVAVDHFALKNTWLTFVRQDSATNYMFLLDRGQKSERETDTTPVRNYASRMNNILNALFDKIPNDLEIRNFNMVTRYNHHEVGFHIDTFNIIGHHFNAPIYIKEDEKEFHWMAAGDLDKHSHTSRFSLFSSDSGKVSIPFIKYRWNTVIEFDTVRFSVEERKAGNDLVTLGGLASVRGLAIDNARIATEKVDFGTGSVDYSLTIGTDYYELDSLTQVVFNRLSFHPYLKYQPRPTKHITLKLDKEDFPAQDLFSSLPSGLFSNLEGLKTKGNLSFQLLFDADLSNPDSLKFECELKRKNFYITSYGNTDFTFINGPFEYTAYEKGEPVRTFMIGPENPNFRTLEQISPLLRNSVINSEDGAFFGHRGFLIESFRESIVTNIKARRFARGGSTITMQLVKNVFLNRNKTISRKLEEAIIVWLIENCGLVTKERMYEVYLNIIEWGPMIYGAQEASRFYFNKDVSRLTYAEAIFLASIIPRPKYFMYSFDKETGHLRDYLINYYQRMADKMLKKEMITRDEYDKLVPDVELKGPAKLLLQKADSNEVEPIDEIL
ncbi:MAG: transglycosylase domain-containing protein [Bacteroidetes bacterium]|nr:transglycosylase domain-containing protein [Bacteroidota bacterium]